MRNPSTYGHSRTGRRWPGIWSGASRAWNATNLALAGSGRTGGLRRCGAAAEQRRGRGGGGARQEVTATQVEPLVGDPPRGDVGGPADQHGRRLPPSNGFYDRASPPVSV